MRIAIDGRALTGRFTGDRTYWRNLIPSLAGAAPDDELIVLTRQPVEEGELPAAPNLRLETIPAANDRLWTVAALPRALRRLGADLLHTQYTAPPAAACPCPYVTTVHDISFRLHPEWFRLRDRLLLNATVPLSMRHAARVITVSESSRADILREYGLPERQVAAIPNGVPEPFASVAPTPEWKETARHLAKNRYGLEGPFVLSVGVLQPRKNLRLLAAAFASARAGHGVPHALVVVGKMGWGGGLDALKQAAGGSAGAIVATGYVPDEDLPLLYGACDLFAYPSLYEGFGLPPLEAMACGAPAVVSDAPAMPEVVGDAARIVPATDREAWAAALRELLCDPGLRAELSRRGIERARAFTWERSARLTLDAYRAALAGA
jgi:glycosyltransferase involved in cell wall biosynthesis